VLDYGATDLTLRDHPLALLRPQLRACVRGSVRQRPGSAKGLVFFTLEYEFGTVNLVLYQHVVEAHRAAVLSARLLLVEGRWRTGRTCWTGCTASAAGPLPMAAAAGADQAPQR
jgi:error-prone DNA polymerase